MDKRLELQAIFEDILGSPNVYFQPPTGYMIKYDAIVYKLSKIQNNFANNRVYKQYKKYDVTLIVRDPDSELIEKISRLPMCVFDRHFTKDGLNHYTYTLCY